MDLPREAHEDVIEPLRPSHVERQIGLSRGYGLDLITGGYAERPLDPVRVSVRLGRRRPDSEEGVSNQRESIVGHGCIDGVGTGTGNTRSHLLPVWDGGRNWVRQRYRELVQELGVGIDQVERDRPALRAVDLDAFGEITRSRLVVAGRSSDEPLKEEMSVRFQTEDSLDPQAEVDRFDDLAVRIADPLAELEGVRYRTVGGDRDRGGEVGNEPAAGDAELGATASPSPSRTDRNRHDEQSIRPIGIDRDDLADEAGGADAGERSGWSSSKYRIAV